MFAADLEAERDGRLDVLSELMSAFASAADLPVLLQTIARRAAEATGDLCGLYLLNEDGTTLLPAALHDCDPIKLAESRVVQGEPLLLARNVVARRVIETGLPFAEPALDHERLRPPATSPRYFAWLQQEQIQGLLVTPLRTQRMTLGILAFTRRDRTHPLDARDIAFAQSLADHAALAIANARLLAEKEIELAEKNRMAERLRLLADAAQAFSAATSDYSKLLDTIAEHLGKLFGDLCSIRTLTPDGSGLEPLGAVYHADPGMVTIARAMTALIPQPIGVGFAGRAAQSGKPVLLANTDTEASAAATEPHFREFLLKLGVSSALAMPLLCRGQLIGVANLLRSRKGNPYTEDDLRLVQSIADHAALAISNAKSYESERLARAMAEVAQRELEQSEERHRQLFDQSPLPKLIFDVETQRIFSVNEAAMRLYGYAREEFRRMKILDLPMPGQPVIPIERAWQLGTEKIGLRSHRRKDGSAIAVDITAHTIMLDGRAVRMVVARDVTEQLSLETQLRQSQKMEAIGRLAGGIAHDFNNLLSVIMSYGEALAESGDEEERQGDVEQIQKAARRASALTRQLLMFSRQQVLEPRVLNINELISGMGAMLQRIVGEDIEIGSELEAALGAVRLDAGSFEQVIMNLVVNSRDAMPTGGKLTIETQNVNLDQEFVRSHLGCVAGPHVMLAVSDTGQGMDRATQERMFEPFFTTKEAGKGTGLGLSTVFGIVQQSGATIWVRSEPGHGTTFQIYLPRVDAAPEVMRPQGLSQMRGNETLLLVEDDDQVRAAAKRILQRFGYSVLAASCAEEAMRISAAQAGKIDLLLSDVVMPRTSGPELARHLERARPGIRVLFMSGYTDDSIVRHGVLQAETAYLQKPLTSESLARKVRELLDEGRAAVDVPA